MLSASFKRHLHDLCLLQFLLVTALVFAAGTLQADQPQKSPNIDITLPDGRRVHVEPFRRDRKVGLSDAQCGVVIDGQSLTVIGEGETEAYSCVRLVEAGRLPPLANKHRIGLIYDVASPNARFRTAAILLESRGKWRLDASTLGVHDDRPEAQSLEALSEALADR